VIAPSWVVLLAAKIVVSAGIVLAVTAAAERLEIGRASCRERV